MSMRLPTVVRLLLTIMTLVLACHFSPARYGLAAATVDVIVIVAGGGTSDDALQRGITSPAGVALAPDGTLHWTTGDQVMRRLPGGAAVVVAGKDASGDSGDGGPATEAVLNSTGEIAFDAAGNLYIACSNKVRKVSATTGIITTVVGNGSGGAAGDGGPAVSAATQPRFLAIDADGNLFISEYYYNYVRRVDAVTGIITAYAGTGARGWNGDGLIAAATQLASPAGLAFDPAGNLVIVDSGNNRIRRVDAATGIVSTIVGGGNSLGDGGPATAAALSTPWDAVIDGDGNLFITDQLNHRIRTVTETTGVITTIAGSSQGFSGDGAPAIAAQFSAPRGIVRSTDGDLFICDSGNHRIRRLIAASQTMTTVAGNGSDNFSGEGVPALAATLCSPSCIIFDASDNQYIVDQNNHRIRKVTKATGIITTVAGNGQLGFSGDGGPAIAAKLAQPSSIVFDNAGDLLITDQYNHRLRKVTMSTGVITTIAGSGPAWLSLYGTHEGDGGLATAARLNQPEYAVVSPNGDIYLSDMLNHRIAKIQAGTNIITTIAGDGITRTTPGLGVSGFSGDGGLATAAKLNLPTCLRLDQDGNLFVADYANSRIRRIAASDGKITTIAGGGSTLDDGALATATRLNNPTSMVFNAVGDLFIADQGNQRIRRMDHSSEVVTTVAGTGTAGFTGIGGPAIAAQLNSPTGVAFDHSGQLFLTQRNVNMICTIVAKTVPEITWNPQAMVYGGTMGGLQLNASATTPGTFVYRQAPGTVASAVGVTMLTATFMPANDAAYVSTSASASLAVGPAPLAVVADDGARVQGAANPAFTYHLDGLVNGDTALVLSGTPALATTATIGSPAGTYPITIDLSGVTAANYAITGTDGTLTVTTSGTPPSASSSGGSSGCGLGSTVAVLLLMALGAMLAVRRGE
jgi:sugar lactone lactonase YvrE